MPVDWRRRRARFGGGGFLVAGRLHILSFTDRDAAAVHFVANAELRLPSAASEASLLDW